MTQVDATSGQVTKMDLCEVCSQSASISSIVNLMSDWSSHSPEAQLTASHARLFSALVTPPRFPLEAYSLVCDSIELAMQNAIRLRLDQKDQKQHVTGSQLLLAFRELMIRRCGKQARAHLAELRIHRTEDIGEIVFEMVGVGLLGKMDEDKPEDFANGYDFSKAFPED